jgi:hypothetical protein
VDISGVTSETLVCCNTVRVFGMLYNLSVYFVWWISGGTLDMLVELWTSSNMTHTSLSVVSGVRLVLYSVHTCVSDTLLLFSHFFGTCVIPIRCSIRCTTEHVWCLPLNRLFFVSLRLFARTSFILCLALVYDLNRYSMSILIYCVLGSYIGHRH